MILTPLLAGAILQGREPVSLELNVGKIVSAQLKIGSESSRVYLSPFSKNSYLAGDLYKRLNTDTAQLFVGAMESPTLKFITAENTPRFMEGCEAILGLPAFSKLIIEYDPELARLRLSPEEGLITGPDPAKYDSKIFKIGVIGESGWLVNLDQNTVAAIDLASRLSITRAAPQASKETVQILCPERLALSGSLSTVGISEFLPPGITSLEVGNNFPEHWSDSKALLSIPSIPYKSILNFKRGTLTIFTPKDRLARFDAWLAGTTGLRPRLTTTQLGTYSIALNGVSGPKLKLHKIEKLEFDAYRKFAASSDANFDRATTFIAEHFFTNMLDVQVLDEKGTPQQIPLRWEQPIRSN